MSLLICLHFYPRLEVEEEYSPRLYKTKSEKKSRRRPPRTPTRHPTLSNNLLHHPLSAHSSCNSSPDPSRPRVRSTLHRSDHHCSCILSHGRSTWCMRRHPRRLCRIFVPTPLDFSCRDREVEEEAGLLVEEEEEEHKKTDLMCVIREGISVR